MGPFRKKSRARAGLLPAALSLLTAQLVMPAAGADPWMSRQRDDVRHPAGAGGRIRLDVVKGVSPVSGPGPRRRFIVEIEHRIHGEGSGFADTVEEILYDRRSWGGNGRLGMKRVDSGRAAFRVTLARPRTVDRLCAPLQTRRKYSCFNGYRAVINSRRWRGGADTYGDLRHLDEYRTYLINHEVGHALGHRHRYCPGRDRPAPVMQQQTIRVRPCDRNWWPLRRERGPAPA